MIDTKTIKQKIHAENELSRVLNNVVPYVNLILKGYEGKKILKVDGSLLKELKEKVNLYDTFKGIKEYDIKPLKRGDNARITSFFIDCSHYSIRLKLTLCFSGGSYEDKTYYCFYQDKNYYLGELNNQILTKLNDFKVYDMINLELELLIYENVKQKAEELKTEIDKFKFHEFRGEKWN